MSTFSLTDHLLIATPSLTDNYFNHTVIYICQHNEEGALGIILNRPLENEHFKDIFKQLKIPLPSSLKEYPPVFWGGPVRQDSGFVLHTPVGNWKSTLAINNHVALTLSRDILESFGNKGKFPSEFRLALGCTGWSPGQLEKEMESEHWLCGPSNTELLFDTPSRILWKKAYSHCGIRNLANFSPKSGHA